MSATLINVVAAPCSAAHKAIVLSPQVECDEDGLPPLPPVNYDCYEGFEAPKPVIRYFETQLDTVERVIEKNYETVKTYVVENVVHHQHNKTVITTVNRNHLHVHKIITKENNYHHFNTDYIFKVNDIHTQRIENLAAEGVTINDFRQTSKVEPATCQLLVEGQCPAVPQGAVLVDAPVSVDVPLNGAECEQAQVNVIQAQ